MCVTNCKTNISFSCRLIPDLIQYTLVQVAFYHHLNQNSPLGDGGYI